MPRIHRDPFAWAAVAIVALAALLEFSRPVNHDVAWILTVADLMHAGRQLYADIIEINPPLIFWAADGMRAVASLLHVAPETVYRVLTLLLGLGSAVSVRRFTGSAWPALALLVGGLILVGSDFGQRDVLIAFLLAPYVAMASAQSRPRHAWLIGVLAGLGVCLKPFYFAVWLMLVWRNRARSADIAFVATGLAYLASVLLFTPAYIPLARALGPSYEGWLRTPWIIQLLSATVLVTLLAVLLTFLARGRSSATGFALAALGSVVALVLQAKPFSYHQQPALIFAIVTAACLVAWQRRTVSVVASCVLLAIASQFATLWRKALPQRAERVAVTRALARVPPVRHTVFLSEFLFHGAPSFRILGEPWRLSVPSLWWLSPVAGQLPDSVRSALTARVAADIARADLVIVDPRTRGALNGVEPFPEQVASDSCLAAALRSFGPAERGRSFVLYRRQPHAEASAPIE